MPFRALIVDDEPLARERLRTLLASETDFRIVAECADGETAVAAIEESRPDVVFLDVQMPELDGFEVLDALGEGTPPLIVFVTAYEEYALRAFEASALDYLLKPFDRARFRRTIERVRARLAEPAAAAPADVRALLARLGEAHARPKRFVVREGSRLVFVPVETIDHIESAGNYVRLHTGGASHLYRATLAELERRLDPDVFVRVHRSAIVNIERVRKAEPFFHGEYILTLADGTRVTSTRTYGARLRELLR